ncbi:MAG TPA: IclR family transcriptional regulator [Pseudonocardia sp.]|uniref:IclR family transcriptional regulator n=1 Tax=Pseudonocardia sp. TaxID=60912 RepID=UPI002ED84AFA
MEADRATMSVGLRRDMELLDALAAADRPAGLGVAGLADRLGRSRSQVSRALRALQAEGLVERDEETLVYRLGWRLYAFAARTAEARLTSHATPYLRRLVSALRETVHLCVLRGDQVLTVSSVSPPHAFRGLGWEGLTVPALTTSAGRVLIADWPGEALAALVHTRPRIRAGAKLSIRTEEDLYRELARVRRHGYAMVDEEFEEGVVGVSAPVYDFRRQLAAAINVSAPKGRLGHRLREAGELTRAAAGELSEALGRPASPKRADGARG